MHLETLRIRVLACLSAMFFMLGDTRVWGVENIAVIRTHRGDTTVVPTGAVEQPTKIGMRLGAGSVFKTGKDDSFIDLFLNQNGPIIRVRPDSGGSLLGWRGGNAGPMASAKLPSTSRMGLRDSR